MLANGTVIYADATSYPDVYYALRGAADSFGIVTRFHIQTNEAPKSVVNYDFNLKSVLRSKEAAADAFLKLQAFAQNASLVDRRLQLQVNVEAYRFDVVGLFWGSEDEFRSRVSMSLLRVGTRLTAQIMPEMLRGQPQPDKEYTLVQTIDWIGQLNFYAWAPLTQPTSGYDQHDTFVGSRGTVCGGCCPDLPRLPSRS